MNRQCMLWVQFFLFTLMDIHLLLKTFKTNLLNRVKMALQSNMWLKRNTTYTSFISDEELSRATRLSTFPDSGLKQGWSGFRVFPSSGMHVCNHVSKKGVSLDGLGSERITWTDRKWDMTRAFYSVVSILWWQDVIKNYIRTLHNLIRLQESKYMWVLTSDPYVCTTWHSMRKEMSNSRARTDADFARK